MFSLSLLVLLLLVVIGLNVSWFLVGLAAILDEAFPSVTKTGCEWQIHLTEIDSKYPQFGFKSFARNAHCPQCTIPKPTKRTAEKTTKEAANSESSMGERAMLSFQSLSDSISRFLLGTPAAVTSNKDDGEKDTVKSIRLFHGNELVKSYVKDRIDQELYFISIPWDQKTWKQCLVQEPSSSVSVFVLRIFLQQQQSYDNSTSILRRFFMGRFSRALYLIDAVLHCFTLTMLVSCGLLIAHNAIWCRSTQEALHLLATLWDPHSVRNMTKKLQKALEELQHSPSQ